MLIPPQVLKAAARAASRDAARYQLVGVHIARFAPGIATATATDGKQLFHARFHDGALGPDFPDIGIDPKEGERAEAIIPLAEIPALLKMAPVRPHKPILAHLQVEEATMNGTIRIGATDLDSRRDVTIKAAQGTFPDVTDAVAPSYSGTRAITFRVNPDYFANMLRAVMDATPAQRGDLPMVEVSIPVDTLSGEVEKAIQLRRAGTDEMPVEAVGLVMPLRRDEPGGPSDLEARAAALAEDLRAVREEIERRIGAEGRAR